MDLEEYEQDIEEQSDGDYEPDEDEIDRDEDYDIEMELEDQLERGTESPEENTELQTISLSELLGALLLSSVLSGASEWLSTCISQTPRTPLGH